MATAGGGSSSGASVGNDAMDPDSSQQAIDVEDGTILTEDEEIKQAAMRDMPNPAEYRRCKIPPKNGDAVDCV
ncbi:unnamed protein product [Sphacelaria rigidula]